LRRRSTRASPVWRSDDPAPARTSSPASGRPQRRASSRASRPAGWCPRTRSRVGSGGIGVMTSAVGASTRSTTSSAARFAARRSPCSFHAATRSRAAPEYATAARARRNARRRPAHSRHRSTGQSVGAPHRPQSVGPGDRRDCRHAAQSTAADAEHETQRGGKTRSRSHALDGTREGVACPSRLRADCVTSRQEGSYAVRVGSPATARRRLSASRSCS